MRLRLSALIWAEKTICADSISALFLPSLICQASSRFNCAIRMGPSFPANPNYPVETNGRSCVANCYNIPIPYSQLVTPGGDFALNGNLEYRYTIAGPVAIAPFVDIGHGRDPA